MGGMLERRPNRISTIFDVLSCCGVSVIPPAGAAGGAESQPCRPPFQPPHVNRDPGRFLPGTGAPSHLGRRLPSVSGQILARYGLGLPGKALQRARLGPRRGVTHLFEKHALHGARIRQRSCRHNGATTASGMIPICHILNSLELTRQIDPPHYEA